LPIPTADSRIKIAFLTVGDPARLTGGYLYHRELFRRLRAWDHTVDEIVAAGAALEAQLAAAEPFGASFDPMPYDLVVVDALARAVCAPFLDRWRTVRPLVAMVHELPSVAAGGSVAEHAFEAPLLRADRLIAVSDDGARILRARGVAPERIVVASGGMDRLEQEPRTKNQRTVPRPGVPPTVLCVAQWIPRKGVLELAQAWARVARPGWLLELVGETDADPVYATLVRAALAAASPGSVAVRGPIDDDALAAAYRRASLFAMPSRYEGYGIAFAEALAHGLPVVGCAVGPVPALVGPDAGLLVPPGDEVALAAALARLLDDAELRAAMSLAARARAAALPTWDECAKRVLGGIRAVIVRRDP
jgi:glycosyltransferase involved in cell wall biosynthesis